MEGQGAAGDGGPFFVARSRRAPDSPGAAYSSLANATGNHTTGGGDSRRESRLEPCAAWSIVILAGVLFRAYIIHQLPREVEFCAADFSAFYSGGSLVGSPQLYSPAAAFAVQEKAIGCHHENLVFIKPPVLCAADVAARATAVCCGVLSVPGPGAGRRGTLPLVVARRPLGRGGRVRVVGAPGGHVHRRTGRDLPAGSGA